VRVFFAAVIGLIIAGSSHAGESRFQAAWNPSARADLVKLTMMDGWTARDVNFALDIFVSRMESKTSSDHKEFLPGTTNTAADAVIVGVVLSQNTAHGCTIASATLSNPMHSTTAISGVFCSKSQADWTYDPKFLEVTSSPPQSSRVTKTFDVSDIGKVRPR
jgi:hypothetical protein